MAEELKGWEILRQLFRDNGLSELADVIVGIAQDAGADAGSAEITEALRSTDVYKRRFQGNTDRLAAGLSVIQEGEYLYNERMYAETMKSYQAGGLATRENFAKFISNDVSVNELQKRFSSAYTRVTNAVNSNDKPLVDELRKLYPGITDNEIANSLLLGKEGSSFLDTRINIAEIKASEAEVGIKSTIGAEALAGKFSREDVKAGLEKTAAQQSGFEKASRMFGEQSIEGIQNQLEQENILGITSRRTKRLASQARSQFSGKSGISTGSLGKKKQV